MINIYNNFIIKSHFIFDIYISTILTYNSLYLLTIDWSFLNNKFKNCKLLETFNNTKEYDWGI